MKNGKQCKFILLTTITFLALSGLLFIQVLSSIRTARIAEQNFNHRVVMALKDSRDEIGRQIQINTSINNYLCGKTCAALERIKHREKLDSIIRSNLEIYNLPSNFKFTISETSNPENASGLFGTKCYQQTLNGLLEQSGIKIRLQFPDRNRFLMAEMTGTFIISILIILFVVWAFLFLLKQSKQRRIQMERTTAFVNNMLHELQTPLANIKLANSLITKNNGSNKTPEYTQIIKNEYEKIQSHVNNVLNLSCDQLNTKSKPLEINKLITDISNEFSYRINELKGEIKVHNYPYPLYTQTYNNQLFNVFNNLVDNAIKYSKEKPNINISIKKNKDQIEIEVSDLGIGISSANLPHIFDLYYRVNTGDIHNIKGFGIGLAYVKQVIENHKGKIKVKSELNKGTTFSITLPLNQ